MTIRENLKIWIATTITVLFITFVFAYVTFGIISTKAWETKEVTNIETIVEDNENISESHHTTSTTNLNTVTYVTTHQIMPRIR